MSAANYFLIGSVYTTKALHALNLLECARSYGSEKNNRVLDSEVMDVVNKRTGTGRASWFVFAWFHLRVGQTKMTKLNVRSVKKADAPVKQFEEPATPVALPVSGRERVDTVANILEPVALELELDTNVDPLSAPLPIPPQPPPPAPEAPIPVAASPTPAPSAPPPKPVGPMPTTAATPPFPVATDELLSTNHGYDWYKYNNPDKIWEI